MHAKPFASIFALLAGLAVVFGAGLDGRWLDGSGAAPDSAALAARRAAAHRAEDHLALADEAGRRGVDESLAPIDRFFAQAKSRTPAFSDKALGWGSKWRIVSDALPGTRGDRHPEFLRQAFEQHLFTADELERLIRQAIQSEVDALDGIENELLVRLSQDLADLPGTRLTSQSESTAFSVAFSRAIDEAERRIRDDLHQDLGRELISLIAGEVLTHAAVRLGVSAGVLGAGAVSSPYTLGLGLVVGLVVDQLVCFVWDWWQDPSGELTAGLNGRLDELRNLIVEGDGESPGLRGRLESLAASRAEIRREAVYQVISQQSWPASRQEPVSEAGR